MFETRFLQSEEALDHQAQTVEVYRDAFTPPPYQKTFASVAEFAGSLPEHTRRAGFSFLAAFPAGSSQMAGFTYGYTCRPETWWYAQVAAQMQPAQVEVWLKDSFQLVEIAVRPEWQGHGVGTQLHDRLLAHTPHARAVLSTMHAETVAAGMYRRRGWQVLVEEMHFPGVHRPYQIMGLQIARQPGSNGGPA